MHVQSYGNGNRDEPDSERKMQQVNISCSLGLCRHNARLSAEKDINRGQGQREPSCQFGIHFRVHHVDLQNVSSRVY